MNVRKSQFEQKIENVVVVFIVAAVVVVVVAITGTMSWVLVHSYFEPFFLKYLIVKSLLSTND